MNKKLAVYVSEADALRAELQAQRLAGARAALNAALDIDVYDYVTERIDQLLALPDAELLALLDGGKT